MMYSKELVEQIANELKAYVSENLVTKSQSEYVRTQWSSKWAEELAESICTRAEAQALEYFTKTVDEIIEVSKDELDDDLNAAYFINTL